jgi:class 3 adenylate cyclase
MPVQTATIVVTDLVASTPLRTALGEERAEEVRRAHDQALIRAAEGASGTVVKHLGDGLLVLFAGSAEALGAAVAMQQALEVVGREERVDLTMRIGVSAGDVTLEGGDTFGTPVVEASRLCDVAEGGQILVAEQVRLLARGRGGLELDPLGTMELKGLVEPIDVFCLRWAPVRTRADQTDDIQVLLERLTGQEVPDCFSQVIAEHTDGNPFFVRETLLNLVESGRVRFEDGSWATVDEDLGIPEGVREVIGRRLSQLSPATNGLLHAAALFDTTFSPSWPSSTGPRPAVASHGSCCGWRSRRASRRRSVATTTRPRTSTRLRRSSPPRPAVERGVPGARGAHHAVVRVR